MATHTTAGASLLDDLRESVDERLQAAVGAGHLSLVEYERRLGILMSDQSTGAAIASITTDLPVVTPVPADAQAQRRKSPRRRGFVAAALGTALVGGGLLIGAPPDGPPPSGLLVSVPEGVEQFDVGRHSGTVVVVVPDGVLALTDAVDAAGDLYCVEACAWPTGPSVRLEGTGLADVLIKSQSELNDGRRLDVVVG